MFCYKSFGTLLILCYYICFVSIDHKTVMTVINVLKESLNFEKTTKIGPTKNCHEFVFQRIKKDFRYDSAAPSWRVRLLFERLRIGADLRSKYVRRCLSMSWRRVSLARFLCGIICRCLTNVSGTLKF